MTEANTIEWILFNKHGGKAPVWHLPAGGQLAPGCRFAGPRGKVEVVRSFSFLPVGRVCSHCRKVFLNAQYEKMKPRKEKTQCPSVPIAKR